MARTAYNVWKSIAKCRVVSAFGGRCGVCGFDKYNSALELHHLNPNEKEFSYNECVENLNGWDILVTELEKCVLLCSNCHKGVHFEGLSIPKDIKRLDKRFYLYKDIFYLRKFPKDSYYKSYIRKTKDRFDWSIYDLDDLLFGQKMSLTEIAKLIGCGRSYLTKRMEKLGIYHPKKRKFKWPSAECLSKEIQVKSAFKISEEIGCSPIVLYNRMRRVGCNPRREDFGLKRRKTEK